MDDSIILEGEKFISSKQAAHLTDYAPDYIGQMCRLGKVRSKMIGRTWYVSEKSLLEHKAEIDNRKKVAEVKVPLHSENIQKPVIKIISPSISVTSDRRVPSKNIIENQNLVHPQNPAPPISKEPVFPPENIPGIKQDELGVDTKNETTGQDIHLDSKIDTLNNISKALIVVLFLGMGVLGLSVTSRHGVASIKENVNLNLASATRSVATINLSRVPSDLSNSAKNISQKISDVGYRFSSAALSFYGMNTLSSDSESEDESKLTDVPTSEGIVIAQLDATFNKDAYIRKVKNSFSDEVNVNFEDENTGVITPVFSDGSGDDYFFVMVPIRD